MACFHPLNAVVLGVKPDGKKLLHVSKKGDTLPEGEQYLKLPCGQCYGCRLDRSKSWALRCMHEASLHKNNCFVTLTYNPEHEFMISGRIVDESTGEILGNQLSLNKRDIMLFLKRLRNRFGDGIRFFQCGEYGGKGGRPHHHVLLFNFDFDDKFAPVRSGKSILWRSRVLEELWPYGFSSVGELTYESAAYTARYILKKINGDLAPGHYCGQVPEFITMSRRPGIARAWFEEYYTSVYPKDYIRVPGKEIKLRPPKYYDKLYDLVNPEGFSIIKSKRVNIAKSNPDNSPERLQIREEVLKRDILKLPRGLELKMRSENL